jgi:hypothetical protein
MKYINTAQMIGEQIIEGEKSDAPVPVGASWWLKGINGQGLYVLQTREYGEPIEIKCTPSVLVNFFNKRETASPILDADCSASFCD